MGKEMNLACLKQADSKEYLKKEYENTFDSIITDPPYELGFMGHDWDKRGIAYDVEFWKECFRVLKPGGFLLSFSHSRTYHRMAVAIEDAGFEIRDQIMWLYGSGFPKSKTLKPAHEPIVVARKPFEGTLKANMEKWGVGKLNIDESKLPNGRHPANVITDGTIDDFFPNSKEGGKLNKKYDINNHIYGAGWKQSSNKWVGYGDSGSTARFFYVAKTTKKDREEGLEDYNQETEYEGLLSKKSRADGKVKRPTNRKNIHPTVKPTALMKHLIKLVTPDDGKILDPFVGSGSTGKAVVELNEYENKDYDFLGIDLNEEYIKIAEKRMLIKDRIWIKK